MDLPNLFSNTIDPVSRLFICCILTDTTIQSLLIQTSVAGTKVLTRSEIHQYTDATSIVVKADESLQQLGKESESINEIIFALESSWLKAGSVVESKKGLLHSVVKELSLKPLGFVIQSEALSQFVVASHAHASAVVLLIDQTKLHVFVIAQGVVSSVETVGRSSDIVADFKEGMARYLKLSAGAYLPAKILCVSFVLEEKELIENQQALLDVTWGEDTPFVQTPTIDLLKTDRAASILAHQAAVAVTAATSDSAVAPPPLVNKQVKSETHGGASVVPVSAATAAEFGFSSVKTASESKGAAQESYLTAEPEDDSPKSFGIPIKSAAFAVSEEESDELSDEAPVLNVTRKRRYNPVVFSAVGFGLGLLILLISGFVWLRFYSTVIVKLTPDTETVTEQVTITLDPSIESPDAAGLKIPAKTVSKELEAQTVIPTTGIKITGEKATGKIKIQNWTSEQKTFGTGTVVKHDKYEFTTTAEVTIPGAVKDTSAGTLKSGTASVAVTAVVIGAEANLNKDTELKVASFDASSYSAVVEENFTGGSSREIKVVAQADQDELVAATKKKILETAREQFAQESGGEGYFTPPISLKVTKTEYSADLEETADEVAVTLTAEVTALSYSAADLQPIAQALLGSKVPAGFVLSEENPEILSELLPAATGATEQKLKASISAQAVPNIQEQTIAGEITDMTPQQAREKLAGQHIASVEIIYLPAFAETFSSKLPSTADRITVQKQ